MRKPYVIGIDIGGQSTKAGVVDARGNILVQTTFDSRDIDTLKGYLDTLTASLNKLIDNPQVGGKDNVGGIGIGAPNGNYYKGTIEDAPNLKWAKDAAGNTKVSSERRRGKSHGPARSCYERCQCGGPER